MEHRIRGSTVYYNASGPVYPPGRTDFFVYFSFVVIILQSNPTKNEEEKWHQRP